MSSENDNVIHGFSKRLALEREIEALAEASTAIELERRARALAGHGEQIVPVLIRHLGTDNAQIRGGLGLVARYLDRDLIVPALHRAAADPHLPGDARLTAVMILERYLDVEVEPALAQTLPDASEVARQSAEEALALAEKDPYTFYEYAEQLLAEPPEIVNAVLDVLVTIDDPRMAQLLMTIAGYAPEHVRQRLVQRIGTIRHPLALQALRTLAHLVPASQRADVQRQVRKLQMAGVTSGPAPVLRGLWSPMDAFGNHFLWFIQSQEDGQSVNLLMLLLHDTLGVQQAGAQADVPRHDAPTAAEVGHLHRLKVADISYHFHLVEMVPALALTLVDDAVQASIDAELPLPAALVTFGHWLWGSGEPDGAASWPDLPPPAESAQGTEFVDLFGHPAFATWLWTLPESEHSVLDEKPESVQIPGSPVHQRIAQALVADEAASTLARRCRSQALWLTLTGESRLAALALAAAHAFEHKVVDHPFVQTLAWRTLVAAVQEDAVPPDLRLLS
ncbi:MAG: hypothetical protein D6775_06900 [Caldilineae bacterium]|nr:MAG: hypothetical protein D6775_06900 [Caldilineae bacterium]